MLIFVQEKYFPCGESRNINNKEYIMKKIVRMMLAAMLIVLTAASMYVPSSAAWKAEQVFDLYDTGFGKSMDLGQFSLWTNNQIPPNGAKPLDRFEVLDNPGPVYGMSGDTANHFSLTNGLPTAHCTAQVFDYIVFTAPIDGVYNYTVTAHTWWNRDAEVGFYCNGSWSDGLICGTANQTKEGSYRLRKGDQIWFLFRYINGNPGDSDPITIDEMKITLAEVLGAQPEEYPVTVAGGAVDSETGKYCQGELVTASADKPEEGMEFDKWVAEGVTLDDETANPVSFRMPAGEVKLTAQYKEIVKHTVKVENGKLVGGKTEDTVAVGAPVTVTASATNDAGEAFDHWEITGIEVEKNDSRQLNFVMPDSDVTLKAVYKSASASGEESVSDGTGTGKAPTTGNDKPADGSVNVVLVVVLTAAISIILTALVMYLIFDKKIKALKK